MHVSQTRQCTDLGGLTILQVWQNFSLTTSTFIIISQLLNDPIGNSGRPNDVRDGITPGSVNAVANPSITVIKVRNILKTIQNSYYLLIKGTYVE